jgi:hypothetical protein
MKKVIRPKTTCDWIDATNNGMHLVLSGEVDGLVHDLIRVVADENDESLWVQIYVKEAIIQIPYQTVKHMVEASIEGVHSESWYEINNK